MPGHGQKSRQQELFLAALLTQPTIGKAAAAAGISEATAGRWMKEEPFQVRYADARRLALGEVMAFLQQTMLAAVAVLRTVMLADTTKPTTKVMAARSILELGLKSVEIEQVEHQMQQLLQQMRELRDVHQRLA